MGKAKKAIVKSPTAKKIDDLNLWVEFIGAKVIGAGATAVGGLEIIDPSFIHAVVPHPGGVAALGISLLLGKTALKPLIAIAKKITSSL